MPIASELGRKVLSISWKWLVWVFLPVLYVILLDKKNPIRFFKLRNNGKNLIRWFIGIIILCFVWQLALIIIKYDKTIPGPLTWIYIFLGAAIPEEFMFRGFVYTKMKEFLPIKYSIILTSLFFVLIHYPGWFIFAPHTLLAFISDTIYIFIISCVWCWIYEKSDSLYPSILFHGLNNIIAT